MKKDDENQSVKTENAEEISIEDMERIVKGFINEIEPNGPETALCW